MSEQLQSGVAQLSGQQPTSRWISAGATEPDEELLRSMETGLHELSQPMTALLCLLEYGSSLEANDELKQVMALSADATERLKVTVNTLRQGLQQERQRRIDERTTGLRRRELSFSQPEGDCSEH